MKWHQEGPGTVIQNGQEDPSNINEVQIGGENMLEEALNLRLFASGEETNQFHGKIGN
jgi:hypothetical protein